jgi:hypothetical protein
MTASFALNLTFGFVVALSGALFVAPMLLAAVGT